MFVATMSYEVHASTAPDARKLLRAELVGRRWKDRWHDGSLMPAGTVWIKRSAGPGETVDDLHAACSRELLSAAQAVTNTGRSVSIVRAWIHVSGAGAYGPAPIGGVTAGPIAP